MNRYIDFRDVELTPDEWLLDHGRILKGECNVLAGEGGIGKTTTLARWIADLTLQGVKVLYLGERNPKGMLKRLLAAGADLEHVRTVNLSDFADIRSSIGVIAQAVEDGFALVILDPLSHFLPMDADSHNDAKMRAVTRPLADLVQETGLTLLGLVHLNKNEGASAIHRLQASTWFKDYPANVVALGVDPNNDARRVMVLLKTNADEGTMRRSLIYEGSLVDVGTPDREVMAMRSVFVGESSLTKDDVFPRERKGPKPERKAEAAALIKELLADGPVEMTVVSRAADDQDIAWRTMERASTDLGVVKRPGGKGQAWVWSLPASRDVFFAESARVRH